jgi:sulfur-oxidizing protein SoxA
MKTKPVTRLLGSVFTLCFSAGALAQANIDHNKADAEFAKFRAEMEDSNPAELNEPKGEELWNAKRGPKNVSLAESCDLGLGLGKLEGAYVQMPRYFSDANAVMDTERRIVWCMTEKQGFKFADIAKQPFQGGNDTNAPDITNLVMFAAGNSRGKPFAIDLKDPKVRDIYETGKEVAKYRAGPYDFACNTCHGADGKRIRMQNLPNISTKEGATKAVMGWPAYRMTGGVALTMQWRMTDCFRQQRFPEPKYASEVITSLLTYMTANANGVTYGGPGIKR